VFGHRRKACRRIGVEARRNHGGAGSGWGRVRNSSVAEVRYYCSK
jgi:hypothetical protein